MEPSPPFPSVWASKRLKLNQGETRRRLGKGTGESSGDCSFSALVSHLDLKPFWWDIWGNSQEEQRLCEKSLRFVFLSHLIVIVNLTLIFRASCPHLLLGFLLEVGKLFERGWERIGVFIGLFGLRSH